MTIVQSGCRVLIAAAVASASSAYGVNSEEMPTSHAPDSRALRPMVSKLEPKCRKRLKRAKGETSGRP